MTDNQQICQITISKNQKPVFFLRMLGIRYQKSVVIIEYGFRFLEGNMMFGLVDGIFVFVPFESYIVHNYIIIIIGLLSN